MARLYSDLLQSTGRRFYYALTTPGVVTPGVATLTLIGNQPGAAEPAEVFRTPATATLTLAGLSLSSPSLLSPATAAIAAQGRQASFFTELVLRVSLPSPVETPEISYAPTLLTELIVSPNKATLTLTYPELNVSQGGNIVILSPARATLTMSTLVPIIGIQPGLATLTIVGLQPSLALNLIGTITPDPAALTCAGSEPVLAIPFIWIDDDPAPAMTWIDDP
jgi:hypothetical protein